MSDTIDQDMTMVCASCKEDIIDDNYFKIGEDKWHIHCFKCYKCEKKLSKDSSFLRMNNSKNSLICSDCSNYKCSNCNKNIHDTAIILSNDESYCRDCFRCVKCHKDIDDLKYAKSKAGLFCYNCHKLLLARKKSLEEPKLISPKKTDEFDRGQTMRKSGTIERSATLAVPKRSTRRPVSPQRKYDDRDESSPEINFQYNKKHVKSNSESVIPQYISKDTDFDESDNQSTGHSRTVSIDDILNSTLDNFDTDAKEANLRKHIRNASINKSASVNKNALEKTPLQNHPPEFDLTSSAHSNEELLLKSPKRHGIIVDQEAVEQNEENPPINNMRTPKNSVDLTNAPLNSPMNIALEQHKKTPSQDSNGLGLKLPPSLDPLNFNYKRGSPVQPPSQLPLPENDEDKVLTLPNSGSLSKVHSTESTNGKKVGRSLSLVSRNLVSNLKKANLLSKQPSNSSSHSDKKEVDDIETHSGWGVTSKKERSKHFNTTPPQSRQTSNRGKSDSTIYSHAKESFGNNSKNDITGDSLPHKRSNSGATPLSAPLQSNNIAMYCTPPLETSNSFNRMTATPSSSGHHYRKSSLQGIEHVVKEEEISNGKLLSVDDHKMIDPVSPDSMPRNDNIEMEFGLRRLKMELRELEASKVRLTKELEMLKISKDKILNEIRELKFEKESLIPEAYNGDDFADNKSTYSQAGTGTTPRKQINASDPTNLPNSSSKGKFWKIFSSGSSNQNLSPQQTPNMQMSPKFQIQRKHSVSRGSVSSGIGPIENKLDLVSSMQKSQMDLNDSALISSSLRASPSHQSSLSSDNGELLFGSSLVKRCAYEGTEIPLIITTCFSIIEKNETNLRTEGIYRKTGSQLLIEEIEKEFCNVRNLHDISDALDELLLRDVHAVASVLKRYLRRLPNPVITYQIYEPLMKLVRDNDLMAQLPNNEDQMDHPSFKQTVLSINSILAGIPIEHFDLLKVLSQHLSTVANYHEYNLMTVYNLALVFAPGLIHDVTGEKDIIDMKLRNYIVEFIIKNHKSIFLL
ncbi:hypothetical protein Kpol_1062p14 [Vanderwaltozyma polyspora DSM 70294]|uniref:Rho-type GTPase-activating protein 1 n=1 Tax=Vanderwaltozyma polyspora (strain ATCC 22028 / DSM 70294 / BCRC 21397 / CBS 2163 / NBRC 10782 / NRRL Y-8283 / UCD 57-17) TaxID=436907 RepID=A7TK71_VANPO|nr:uncharacterized protein Kpol_1062p14 [Vanderwaltozyma polyspora DSM 70294]EDO17306.1 hypothetical protein Kpol_1062p14 [Vanderwaltozyma polyspora DSM 70294]